MNTPGLEPVFVAKFDWRLAAWGFSPPDVEDLCCLDDCGGLHSVRQVLINREEDGILQNVSDVAKWEAVLHFVQNVRALYIHAE